MRNGILFALIAIAVTTQAGDESDAKFATFKQIMMPKVGKKIQVAGRLEIGKMGWWLSLGGWGVYIYATTNADIPKDNGLNRFDEQQVTITGTLRHRDAVVTDGTTAGVPEHFYFDVAEASVKEAKSAKSTPNEALERTAARRVFKFQMIKTLPVEATLALCGGRSACSR